LTKFSSSPSSQWLIRLRRTLPTELLGNKLANVYLFCFSEPSG
jgi:hypothetical protein